MQPQSLPLPPSWRRALPAAVATAAFGVMAALWLGGAHQAYDAVFAWLGVHAFRFPFLDTHAVLAAIACHRLGIDVFASDPCDVLGRPHVYGLLWLHLDVLPVSTGWTAPVGLGLGAAFLASLAMLPPARSWRAAWVVAGGAASPATAYALERGNNDLVIFLLAMLIAWLLRRPGALRCAAHGVIVLAAALKFYPAALLALAWRERWPRALALLVLALAALAACLLPDAASLRRVLAIMPAGTADTFGAKNIPAVYAANLGWPAWSATALEAALLGWMSARAIAWARRLQAALAQLTEPERVSLAVGAALLVGCFVTGQNAGYRAIHLLFVIPGLLAVANAVRTPPARLAAALAPALMWSDALRAGPIAVDRWIWLAEQAAWWMLTTWLAALLLAMLADSPALRSLAVTLQHRPPGAGAELAGSTGRAG
jgi:hypothetical protein